MLELNWSRCVLPPFGHQKVGVRELVKWDDPDKGRVIGGVFALFDEMGAGKTKQIVDAGSFLHEMGDVDTGLVVSPATVRSVWTDAEIPKHAFVESAAYDFHNKGPKLLWERPSPRERRGMVWYVTNFEFLRDEARVKGLVGLLKDRKVWMVVDESSRIKNHRAQQTKAVTRLGRQPWVRRRTILNGTPIANNLLDLYAQMNFLDPRILDVQNFYHFRAKYAVIAGPFKKIVAFQNVDDLQRRIAPYVLRRLKKDCLDLPEKLYQTREVALSSEAWKLYVEMRDDAVANLGPDTQVIAPQAVVRLLRLSQICAGFLGGVEQLRTEPELDFGDGCTGPYATLGRELREVDHAKLHGVLELVDDILGEGATRVLIWCRFRAELERYSRALSERGVEVHHIMGGQTRDERETSKSRFMSADPRPIVLLGTPGAGGLGLTLTSAHHVIYASNDYNMVTRLQSEDRVHRPGQRNAVIYVDVCATGPKGQRTIDHIVRKALLNKENTAAWTAEAWRRELLA